MRFSCICLCYGSVIAILLDFLFSPAHQLCWESIKWFLLLSILCSVPVVLLLDTGLHSFHFTSAVVAVDSSQMTVIICFVE